MYNLTKIYNFILFYFILFYFILFYFILFYFILFYFILFYFIKYENHLHTFEVFYIVVLLIARQDELNYPFFY